MSYAFVTSMSLPGYEQYGKAFVETFTAQSDYPLFVFSEDDLPITRVSLWDDPQWREFQVAWPDDPPDWRYQAKRFSHKVFSVTNPRDYDWWIWIDADVEVFDRIDAEFLERACPADATLTYLGRKDCRTSECGWVAYNMNNGGLRFLEAFRNIYVSGEIFDHLEWHDSYIFDRVREKLHGNYVSLSEGIGGMHPWDSTILGEKMTHKKGPLRKKGASLEGLPAEYRSARE